MSVISASIVTEITSAFKSEATAVAASRVKQDKAIQHALDAMTIACTGSKADFLKGNASTNPNRKEIQGIFDGLVADKHIAKASADMYRSAFWMAFESGVSFKRDLASKPKAPTVAKTPGPAKQVSVTRENLLKSIASTIAMAKALGLIMFAQELQELATESLAQ